MKWGFVLVVMVILVVASQFDFSRDWVGSAFVLAMWMIGSYLIVRTLESATRVAQRSDEEPLTVDEETDHVD